MIIACCGAPLPPNFHRAQPTRFELSVFAITFVVAIVIVKWRKRA